MAGYLITLNNERTLYDCFNIGVYSTNMTQPKGIWQIHHEGTFADYATMKPGDNIYFFIKRKIYGIGVLKLNGIDCKYNNFPKASLPIEFNYEDIKDDLLIDFGINSANNRWLCTFVPDPCFFKKGIDMDDVLSSAPAKFRMIRALWKLSFIKIDDEENKALKDIIMFRNRQVLEQTNIDDTYEFNREFQERVINADEDYRLNPQNILRSCANGDRLRHEMALEAGILFKLCNNTISCFGKWDYLSHQVVASPFKPIDYMDKMDIFGYRYLEQHDTIAEFMVTELKKDVADKEVVYQTMKYVDWICHEYAFNDYSRIRAYIVAADFSHDILEEKERVAVRNYTVGFRPTIASTWKELTLVKYRFKEDRNDLDFEVIE